MDRTTTGPPSLKPGEFLVTVQGRTVRIRTLDDERVEVDGREVHARVRMNGDGIGILEIDRRIVRLQVEDPSVDDRTFSLQLNGRPVTGTIDDRRTLLRRSMQGAGEDRAGAGAVKAPMPGLVLKVLVQAGQRVEKGQGLVVLEAMKMENELRSDRTGLVEAVHVSEKSPVEKGQTLLTLQS